jgi:hypothetical protein
MAFASVTYTSASGTTFALTNNDGNAIEYLRQSDISVTVNGTLQTLTTDYTFNAAGTSIVLNSAVSGATVVLNRTTSITDATVSFTAGSTLTAQDLNNSDRQNRFALQEFSDTYGSLTTGTGDLQVLGGFIGSAETWVADNAHAATTGAIDARIDSKTATKLTDDVVAGNAITVTDNSPSTGKITVAVTDGAIDTAELTDSAVTAVKLASNAVTTAKINDGAVTNAKLADAELQTLAGIGSDQASSLVALTNAEIQTLDGITASTAELNQLDGITVSTSFSNSATQIATSSAVNSFVTNLLDSLGGFVAIPDDQSFPTTNPDPSDNAGTVVSIADAGGLVIDASGETTTGRTTGGAVVTITGFPAVYHSSTLLAGLGIQVQTTATLNTYTYHKSLPTDADIAQLNDDVNDFFARYRISATNPTTDNDTGDLVFNTTANELRVFNGTDWQGGVTATGNLVSKSGDTMTGALGITSGSAASPSLFISGDTNTGLFSPGADELAVVTGGTARLTVDSAGNISANSNTIGSVANPSSAQDAATKNYVDTTTTANPIYVAVAGDAMTGALAMGTNKVTGVGDPTAAQDAATKNYVDTTTTANPIYAAVAGDNFTGTVTSTERTITAGAFDLSTGNFWTCGNIAVPNPTNATAGTAGLIRVTAAPASFGGNFDWPAGAGYVAPTAFPAVVPFFVVSSTQILMGNFVQGIA